MENNNNTLNFSQLLPWVKADLKAGLTPMLLGEPGIGKSSFLLELANIMKTKVFSLPANQLADRADLTGARIVNTNTKDKNGKDIWQQEFFPHAIIMDAIHYAEDHPKETPILFLDEINRAGSDITSAALSFTTTRQIGSIYFPENLRFVLAGNNKGNVTALDEASISRFSIYETVPDLATFLSLEELHPCIKDTLLAHPECLVCKSIAAIADDDGDTDAENIDDYFQNEQMFAQITVPRTITYLNHWLQQFSNQDLMGFVQAGSMQAGIQAHVGDTQFAAYFMENLTTYLTTNLQNNGTANSMAKPAAFDDLRTTPTRTELDSKITALSDPERSACLLYAMYDSGNNANLITALANGMTSMERNDTIALSRMIGEQSLDADNVRAFLDTNSVVANGLSPILQSLIV